jgi:hypothetical protein
MDQSARPRGRLESLASSRFAGRLEIPLKRLWRARREAIMFFREPRVALFGKTKEAPSKIG